MSQAPPVACVDDDAAVCSAIISFLLSHGIAAEGFPSAEALLESPDLERRWCIITDVRLPGLSGLQLQSKLLQAGLTVPIIFMTAFADEQTRSRVLSNGAVCFLSKPVAADALLEGIEQARLRRPL